MAIWKIMKIFLSLIIFLFGVWTLTIIGWLNSEKYCIDDYCIQKPKNFYFYSFISEQEQQNTLCIYQNTCRDHFQFDNTLHALTFKHIFGHYLTFILDRPKNVQVYNRLGIIEDYKNCKISHIKSNHSDFMLFGYFVDTNISFSLSSDKEIYINQIINNLCDQY